MGFIIGILLLAVLGGMVLRFSKRFKISTWQVVIYLLCWIIGGVFLGKIVGDEDLDTAGKVVTVLVLIFLPWIIIHGLKLVGRFIGWALGGWSSDGETESKSPTAEYDYDIKDK